jgi:uncharacterized membrane protein
MTKNTSYLYKSLVWSSIGLLGWLAFAASMYVDSIDQWNAVSLALFAFPVTVIGVFAGLLYAIASIPYLKNHFRSLSQTEKLVSISILLLIVVNICALAAPLTSIITYGN